jgi:hypothetical protein
LRLSIADDDRFELPTAKRVPKSEIGQGVEVKPFKTFQKRHRNHSHRTPSVECKHHVRRAKTLDREESTT